jgi:hypothetical protein
MAPATILDRNYEWDAKSFPITPFMRFLRR